MSSIDFSKVAFQIPTDLETFIIETKQGDLVIREPIAADFALIESLAKNPNIHERVFSMALRLAITLNGEEGVSIIDLGRLDRKAYKEVTEMMTNFYLDIVPSFTQGSIQQYLQDQQQ